MKASELREKNIDELKTELEGLLRESFNLRMQKATGQLGQVHQLKDNRRSVARIKTILRQKAGN